MEEDLTLTENVEFVSFGVQVGSSGIDNPAIGIQTCFEEDELDLSDGPVFNSTAHSFGHVDFGSFGRDLSHQPAIPAIEAYDVFPEPSLGNGKRSEDVNRNISEIFGSKNLVSPENNKNQRTTWGKKLDFLLSVIGFSVDLANIWRFPYLCYKNGGGAFLIPYVIFLILGGMPLFYMELALGQYHKEGAISVWWKICPLLKGVGWAVILMAFYVATYYNVIIAWGAYYLISSFSSKLPWTSCDNEWNTDYCIGIDENFTQWREIDGELVYINSSNGVSSTLEFFERGMLNTQFSDGLEDIGQIKWQLVMCLLVVLFVVYFAIFKGVKSSGKVVWVTALLPYVVLTVLLIRGVLLPGSKAGIEYYLTPDLNKLTSIEVWLDAATQIFYSLGAGFGVLIAFASYNKTKNNCARDAIITSSINCLTSFGSGFVIFCYLGYLSNKTGQDIGEVATEGPGLVFVVYPEAISTLTGSVAWSIIFFIMLMCLGLDSSMGGMEAMITGLTDEFPNALRGHRELLSFGICGAVFLVALANITYGGLYVIQLLDSYAAGISILFAVFIEAVAVSWIYGVDRFSEDIEKMHGSKPFIWWRICWKFLSPAFLLVMVICGIIYYQPLMIDDYVYPEWSNVVGWMIALSSMGLIPLFAVYRIIRNPGNFKTKLAFAITPESEQASIREGKELKQFQASHWLSV